MYKEVGCYSSSPPNCVAYLIMRRCLSLQKAHHSTDLSLGDCRFATDRRRFPFGECSDPFGYVRRAFVARRWLRNPSGHERVPHRTASLHSSFVVVIDYGSKGWLIPITKQTLLKVFRLVVLYSNTFGAFLIKGQSASPNQIKLSIKWSCRKVARSLVYSNCSRVLRTNICRRILLLSAKECCAPHFH